MQRPLLPPVGGAADPSSFDDQPVRLAPVGSLLNMRPFDRRGRRRFAQRGGIRRLFGQQFAGGAPGRAAAVIHRPAGVSGLTPANCVTFAGVSSPAGLISGNHTILDPEIAMFAIHTCDSTASGGSAFEACQHGHWHPDGERYAVLSNYVDGVSGLIECRVELRSAATGAVLWDATIADPSADRFADTLTVTQDYVVIATNNKLRVHLVSDGSLVTEFDVPWASHAVKVDRNAAGTLIAVAFNGSYAAGMTVGGTPIEPGVAASQFRSGVMLFAVAAPPAAQPLVQVQLGPQLPPTDPWSEGSVHGYWRISEQARYKPRGANVTDMCFGPDGSIYLLTTNQGIGPNNTYPPDGSGGYVTVRKISPNGVLAWEADTLSIRRSFIYNGTTYYCDIIEGTSDDPSVQAVAVDAEGFVYVGGRQNAAGQSAFCFSPDGVLLWATNLVNAGATASVRQAAAAVDPQDNNPVFAFDRSASWTGASGRNAILIKLDRATGAVIKHYDLGAAVSGLSVSYSSSRQLLLCHDKVS